MRKFVFVVHFYFRLHVSTITFNQQPENPELQYVRKHPLELHY